MRFFIVDVFAEQRYQGNQLAVFVLNRDLDTAAMQKIAREVHFSECTFVAPGERNGGFDVRIFTPDMEVAFAGHPTLGTAYVIREMLEWTRSETVVLNEGVGAIPVRFAEGRLTMALTQPSFGPVIADRDAVSQILGIASGDLDGRYPIENVSTGLPSVIVPLTSMAAVSRCAIRHDLYARFLESTVKAALLVFSTETADAQNDLHVRVFVDDEGFFEDPATGSANGNLAAYLLKHRYFGRTELNYRVEQGREMGRPSILEVSAAHAGDTFDINIGGRVVPVAEGTWVD